MNVITNTTVLPEQFESVEEAADFWDAHSLADYWDQVHEVEIEVRARRRRRVMLSPDVWEKVVSQARSRTLADVIRQHRSEHDRELLTAACQEAIWLGAVEPVFGASLLRRSSLEAAPRFSRAGVGLSGARTARLGPGCALPATCPAGAGLFFACRSATVLEPIQARDLPMSSIYFVLPCRPELDGCAVAR